jgi:hypothetical protein
MAVEGGPPGDISALFGVEQGRLLDLSNSLEPTDWSRETPWSRLECPRSLVVKIEQIPGRLEIEYQALSWLCQMDVDVPRVHRLGSGTVGGEPFERCLVTERIDGKPPRSPAAWCRMGWSLQRLEGVPWRGSVLRATFCSTVGHDTRRSWERQLSRVRLQSCGNRRKLPLGDSTLPVPYLSLCSGQLIRTLATQRMLGP